MTTQASHPAILAFGIYLAGVLCAAAWQVNNGKATFTNPQLYACHPSSDIVRVEKHADCTEITFANLPRQAILHSLHFVKAGMISRVIPRLNDILTAL